MDKNSIEAIWSRDLDESRADLEADRVVDGRYMRDRLRATIEYIERSKERPEEDGVTPVLGG